LRIEFGDVEGAAGDAILAADAIVLLEIDDAVLILHDGVVGGAGCQAAGVGAVHALVLAHEPLERAVGLHMLAELDQVPIVPRRFGHGLIGVLKNGFAEGEVVPLHAGDFTGLASDAGGGVDQFGEARLALRTFAGHWAGAARDGLDAQICAHASFSSLTRKPLNSGV
jgi:hypothetical protein